MILTSLSTLWRHLLTLQKTPTFAGSPGAVKAGRGAVAVVGGGAVAVHGGDWVPVLIAEVGVWEIGVTSSVGRRLAITHRFCFTKGDKYVDMHKETWTRRTDGWWKEHQKQSFCLVAYLFTCLSVCQFTLSCLSPLLFFTSLAISVCLSFSSIASFSATNHVLFVYVRFRFMTICTVAMVIGYLHSCRQRHVGKYEYLQEMSWCWSTCVWSLLSESATERHTCTFITRIQGNKDIYSPMT